MSQTQSVTNKKEKELAINEANQGEPLLPKTITKRNYKLSSTLDYYDPKKLKGKVLVNAIDHSKYDPSLFGRNKMN